MFSIERWDLPPLGFQSVTQTYGFKISGKEGANLSWLINRIEGPKGEGAFLQRSHNMMAALMKRE